MDGIETVDGVEAMDEFEVVDGVEVWSGFRLKWKKLRIIWYISNRITKH